MHDQASHFASARLDFLTQFRDDVAADGPRELEHYRERFPELAEWLETEYARLLGELRSERSHAPAVDVADDARLVAELEARRTDSTRYRRDAELGRGGTGRVYSVRDVQLGRDLAMKVLQRTGASSLRRFLREARITSRLEHPGVLPVHELGLDAHGDLYFTMRLVRGRSLKALFDDLAHDPQRTGRRAAIEALLKVCDTMAFAHAQGVIHRDLKPSNVMLGDYGEVYVVDWGLARALARGDEPAADAQRAPEVGADPTLNTLTGDVLGTPAYMPPEQAIGDQARVERPSDVYSVGAMLYHLLAGRAPYLDGISTPDSHAVLVRVLDGPPPEIARVAPDAPAELLAIVRRSMARDPRDRYPSCAEMAADLRAFLEERIVRAHSSGPWVHATKWVRRNQALSAVLAVSLLLAVGALLGWSRAQAKEDDLDLLATLRGPVELLLDFDALWPASEEQRGALSSWLARTEELRAAVPQLESMLAELRSSGERLPLQPWLQDKEIRMKQRRLEEASAAIELTQRELTHAEYQRADGGGDERTIERLRANVASLERHRRVVEARSPERIAWSFADPQTQLLHDRIDQFLSEFDLACGRTQESSEIALVRAALAALDGARGLDREEWRTRWDEATTRIAASELYSGLVLAPQRHLWPVGQDPASGLWEFADELTGSIPLRDASGSLVLEADSAIVFVLVPRTERFVLGSQDADPSAPCFDAHARSEEGPLVDGALAAYFIGKHELNRRQWERLSGDPMAGLYADWERALPYHDRLPADNMRGNWAGIVLAAYGLALPTSIQWEHAARAGTQTVWWTGAEVESLAGSANVADRQWLMDGRTNAVTMAGVGELDDGAAQLTVIGAHCANPFGLHDTAGNVAEWCLDRTETRMTSFIPPNNRLYPRSAGLQIVRGGSFQDSPLEARSAARWYLHPEFHSVSIGVRAARDVDSAR